MRNHAHPAPLNWFTNLSQAIAEARRTNRPILSLRLLGRLDEELSCANSRFFRKTLYVDPTIQRMMREQFVLHWQSIRPVPRVTIDFGGGRRIVKTLTGNSAHLVLDCYGRVVDVLPGLFSREVFTELLARSHAMAIADRHRLAAMHRRALDEPVRMKPVALPRSLEASMLAATKHIVEAPVLRAVTVDVEHDTRTNLGLHTQVHQLLATGVDWNVDQIVDWLYRELFLMPLDDPFLGLDIPDPF